MNLRNNGSDCFIGSIRLGARGTRSQHCNEPPGGGGPSSFQWPTRWIEIEDNSMNGIGESAIIPRI